MFSVIIPLYNKAAYVEKAIRSVLAQTYREFELIIVDDGSKDESWEVVQRLFSSLAPPLGGWEAIQQQNQGVSTARNNGVKAAKYDYIAFLDADDWWEPTYLEEMKGLIEEFPEAGLWSSNYYIVKSNRKRVAPIGVEKNFERGLINYCKVYARTLCMPVWTGATIVLKAVFESEKGFKPTLKLGEDFDLWIRIAMKYPIVLLNKPLANYNQEVELINRAIGGKLYEPAEHILFMDYGELQKNPDFRYLYERLAVYGLLDYYLTGKNKKEVDKILSGIDWKHHAFKYRLFYRILPKTIVRLWMRLMKFGSVLKKMITTQHPNKFDNN